MNSVPRLSHYRLNTMLPMPNYSVFQKAPLAHARLADVIRAWIFRHLSSVFPIKFISIIAVSLTVMGEGALADQFGYFTYRDNGTSITITGYPFGVVGAVEIPASIVGKPVTAIGKTAFVNCTQITSVIIPNSVTSIYDTFSGCSGLTGISVDALNPTYSSLDGVLFNKEKTTLIDCPEGKVGAYSIPNSVTSIGEGAFFDCAGLTSVTISNSVTSIGKQAFQRCTGLTSLTIPSGVTNIGEIAFGDCTGLKSVTLSATSIGDSAFVECTGLTSVMISNSVTSIGAAAFRKCSSLVDISVDALNPAFSSLDGVLFNKAKTTLIQVPGSKVAYSIPTSVTQIGKLAFSYCSRLTSVTIPGSVISIGQLAFDNCTGLKSLIIPNSVISISLGAFLYCRSLTSVTLSTNLTSVPQQAFEYCSGLTSVTIPNSVTSIGSWAFSDCTGLTSAPIPSSVTSIGLGAFQNCRGLTSVTLPNNVTRIESFTFSGCTGLTSVTIPSSVTSIGDEAFRNCTGLTSVILPNGMTRIGKWLFGDCSGLTSVTIPNGVISIGDYAFRGCSGLTSVTIPGSVTSIGDEAFGLCTGLTSVTISNGVTSIGNYAFSGCTSLTGISVDALNPGYSSLDGVLFNKTKTILIRFPGAKSGSYSVPNTVTSIEDSAFYGCAGLTSVTIPGSVTSIGKWAFGWCTGLTSVTIPNGVTSIGNDAFVECTGLTSVMISNSVTSIGAEAFDSCSILTGISVDALNADYSSLDGVLFNKTKTILIKFPDAKSGSYSIPNTVTSIGDSAFYECAGLTSVTIPGSVTSIGEWTFGDCTGLTSVTIPNGVTSISYNAFTGCSGLTSVTFPNSVTSIGGGAFSDCTGLTSALFAGNAPVDYMGDAFSNTAAGFKIYFIAGSTNFTTPTWNNYPAAAAANGSIIIHPAANVAFSGATATLTVIAISTAPLTYQWYEGTSGTTSKPVGTNSASFTTPALFTTTSYWVKVTSSANPTGANSTTATVTVVTAPSVATGTAIDITSVSAILNGTANPNGSATTAQFEYGLTTAYGSTVSVTLTPNNGTMTQIVSTSLSGLQPGQIYHYRLTANTSGGIVTGEDLSFTTPATTTTLANWLLANGFPADTNPLSDPNGDGVNFLMAFALNLNPKQNLISSMPRPVITGDSINFKFYAGREGITYTVESSSDLKVWSTDGVTVSAPDGNMLRSASIVLTGPRRYLRLVVTR